MRHQQNSATHMRSRLGAAIRRPFWPFGQKVYLAKDQKVKAAREALLTPGSLGHSSTFFFELSTRELPETKGEECPRALEQTRGSFDQQVKNWPKGQKLTKRSKIDQKVQIWPKVHVDQKVKNGNIAREVGIVQCTAAHSATIISNINLVLYHIHNDDIKYYIYLY